MALIGGIPFYDFKKLKEDNMLKALEVLDDCELLMAYKYLRNRHGISMENIDNKIDEAVKKQYLVGNAKG